MSNETPPLDPRRALRIVEGLVMECDDELSSLIYTVAHAGNNHPCHKNHPDFATRALEIEARLVADNVMPPWEEPT